MDNVWRKQPKRYAFDEFFFLNFSFYKMQTIDLLQFSLNLMNPSLTFPLVSTCRKGKRTTCDTIISKVAEAESELRIFIELRGLAILWRSTSRLLSHLIDIVVLHLSQLTKITTILIRCVHSHAGLRRPQFFSILLPFLVCC